MNLETHNGNGSSSEKQVIGSIRVIESKYNVQRPIFEDVKIERPVYVDKKIEVPTGMEDFITELCSIIAEKVIAKVTRDIEKKLGDAISNRIKEIEVPTITYKEEVKVITKDVEVTNAVITDKHVLNAVITDKEIVNPILIDKKMINPIFEDVTIERPIYQDRVVINPVFTDVVIERPKYKDKEIVVIHPKYIDMKGNPDDIRPTNT